MPYGLDGDSGSAPHFAVSASAGTPDSSDEKSDLGLVDGNRCEPQQTALTQGGIFSRVARDQQRVQRKYPSASAAEPGNDRPIAEDRIRPGQFSRTRPGVGRKT